MKGRSRTSLIHICSAIFILAARAAYADPASDSVTVTASPIGRFGFGTGSGGMLWHSAITHLVINQIQPGGPAQKGGLRAAGTLAAGRLSATLQPRIERLKRSRPTARWSQRSLVGKSGRSPTRWGRAARRQRPGRADGAKGAARDQPAWFLDGRTSEPAPAGPPPA